MKTRSSLLPSFILYALIILVCFLLRSNSLEWGFDFDVIMIGATIVFFTTLISSWMLQRSLNSSNPQSFVRAMYGSFILKFFVLVIAAFAYIMLAKKDVNKQALFTCMGLYLIFTFIEISALTKKMKQKKNA